MAGVSIVIPYYNRANTLDRCLRSIGNESQSDIEIIVVDDCSSHPLPDIDDPRAVILRLESNMGPVAARAYGAERASKEYLLFLDSDDELLPAWRERFLKEIEQAPGFDVYGFPDEKYAKDESFEIDSLDGYWRWVQSERRASDYILAISAEAYRAVPMPSVRISEIWYIVQLFEAGLKVRYSDRSVFRYHQDSGNQLSKQRFLRIDTSPYARKSIAYAVSVFRRNESKMKGLARAYRNAWLKRLFKECILSLNLGCLLSLILRKNAPR